MAFDNHKKASVPNYFSSICVSVMMIEGVYRRGERVALKNFMY